MSTPARILTNDYKDCKLIRLGSKNPKSPLIMVQEGCDPNDTKCRMRMFYLQRDGMWIEKVAHSTLPDSEAGDIVFENTAEALQVLNHNFGKPVVRNLPVTEADICAYMAKVKDLLPEELFHEFLDRYRALNARS